MGELVAGATNGGFGGVMSPGTGGEFSAMGGLAGAAGSGGASTGTTDEDDFFLPAVNYPLPNYAVSVQMADLDRDLARELVVATRALGSTTDGWSLNVLHNDGKGAFEVRESYPQAATFGSFVVGDFNGDSAADVIVSNSSGGALRLMENLHNGKLKPPVDLSVTTSSSYVASADVNGDHKLDLVIVRDMKLAFALNQGTGTFASPQPITDISNVDDVGFGDLTGDGTEDVVLTLHTDQLQVFISNAAGAFAEPVSYPNPSMVRTAGLRVSDLDGDNKADVVTYAPGKDSGPGFASVFLNRGDGSLVAGEGYPTGAEFNNPIVAGPPGTGPYSTATGDLDGDGDGDLLFANLGATNVNGSIGVRLNDGAGKFPTLNRYSVGAHPNLVMAAELSGDNKADVVFLDQNKLYVRLTK